MTKSLPSIYGDTPFGTAAKITINNLLQKMISHLDGTIEGSDIEALHDMRVASRRLRAALRVFKSVFPKDKFLSIETYVKDITTALGTVRDQDVFLEFLNKYKNAPGIEWLIKIEEASREKLRTQMVSILTSLKKGNLILDMEEMLRKASDTRVGVKKNRIDAHAKNLIQPRMEDLIKLSYSLTDPLNITELHQMRISAKYLRYTMETFIPYFGKPLEDLISEIKLLQEQLGNIHDCDVWIDRLNRYLDGYLPSPDLSFSIQNIISERRFFRMNEFNQAVIHWQEMLNIQFSDRLLKLVSAPGIEPTRQGGTELEQEKQLDTNAEEMQAEELQEKKPVRRRSRVKKEAPVETINTEATLDETTSITDSSDADTAIMETTIITEIPETSDETVDISEDTAKQISEPIEEMVLNFAVPVEENETDESEETSSTGKEQKSAVLPETPQHPGIVNLKELIKQTSIRLTNADKFTKKMSKQLDKLNKQLDRLPNRLRKLPMKEAVKAEKYIFRLREHLSSVPEDGAMNGKSVEKLRQEIRTLRNKLPSGKASR